MNISEYKYDSEKNFKLSKINADDTGKYKSKEASVAKLQKNIDEMIRQQDMLYAQNDYSLLIIFQAMDTAGKDGVIKHVMSGVNPQGTQVFSFKQPSSEELDHDYLWRINKCLPERGRIGIFNRSYYEEVLVTKVHDLVSKQSIPKKLLGKNLWENRYSQIRNYEKYLYQNGIIPVKFFLHISKDEQKNRLLARIEDKSKNWKFSDADVKERTYWDEYQKCYEEAIANTSTKNAPWYVIPSNHKWYSRLVVSEVILNTMKKLNLKYPEVGEEQMKMLEKCKEILINE